MHAAKLVVTILAQFVLVSAAMGAADDLGDIALEAFLSEYLAPTDIPRRALVLGNEKYTHLDPVTNAINDADSVETQLESLNFQVIKRLNTNRGELFTAIDDLAAVVEEGDVVTIFYAGHGLESEHVNYLLPVDAIEWPASRVPFETLPTSYILEAITDKRPSALVVILDACRERPFPNDTRGSGRAGGLASQDAPTGVLIAFAASPGFPAWSGSGRKPTPNSIYTTALVKHIRTPGVQIESMFKHVRTAVLQASQNNQRPWESTSLLGDIILLPTPDDMERDRRVWMETLKTKDRSIIATFLTQFPTSRYSHAARKWLASESQESASGVFEPFRLAGNLESSSIVFGTEDFASSAIVAKDVRMYSAEDPNVSFAIGKGTPVEVLIEPDDLGRAQVKVQGRTGYITGVTSVATTAAAAPKTETFLYQNNGALPDGAGVNIAEWIESQFAPRSPAERMLWQLSVPLPDCRKERCAGGFTPRQRAWLNGLQLRSTIAVQTEGKKSLIIRVPANTSNDVRNSVAISGTVESVQ